jgi:rare lipoprotein A
MAAPYSVEFLVMGRLIGAVLAWIVTGFPATAGEQAGVASYYCGRLTASGERMNCGAMTAAHRTLPFGTMVTVTGRGGRSVTVRINDRGPFIAGRVIDLTPAGARALGLDGVGPVTLRW